jgi:hypothetical protein
MLKSREIKKDNVHITSLQLQSIKNGKLPTSHRYNRLPLLRSHPGGFSGAGCVGLAGAKIGIYYKFENNLTKK